MLQAILFDLDGVIVDSRKSTIQYFQETFRHFNLPVPKEEDFLPLLGLKTLDITKKLLPNLSEEKIHPIYKYSKKMSIKYASQITLIHGAIDVLQRLKVKYKLGILTNRSKNTVNILFRKYALYKLFDVVIDREDIIRHKPHPEGIFKAMKKLRVKPHETIYIGDSQVDVKAAKNARVRCVFVSLSKDDYGADYHIATIQKLQTIIDAL